MDTTVVIGGGVVGLATALALSEREPDRPLVVVEKEDRWAAHQSGRNSGVVHSGLYYRPGSLKARLAVAGARSMVEFCTEYGLPVAVPGKLVVAATAAELPRMRALLERGVANGVPVREIGRAEMAEREPHVRGVGALYVASTGVCDYAAVAATMARVVQRRGGELRLGTEVVGIRPDGAGAVVQTTRGELRAARVVNCAGLHSDRVARTAGGPRDVRVVPFRGEYRDLVGPAADLVRGLVYPVPDPDLPFLGVHVTRSVHGTVHVGPNAVPAGSREGYRWRDVAPRDLWDAVAFRGSWRLAARQWRYGVGEVHRSLSTRAFVRALQRLVPEVTAADLAPAPSGVRAQAVGSDGSILDDFVITRSGAVVHVLNAPSPAATACLGIGHEIVDRLAPLPG